MKYVVTANFTGKRNFNKDGRNVTEGKAWVDANNEQEAKHKARSHWTRKGFSVGTIVVKPRVIKEAPSSNA